jgi:hypothetical protein
MAVLLLERGLETLGELLAEEQQTADLVLIGGGALLLQGELDRPTGDLDVVALVRGGILEASQPFPDLLVKAVRRVGAALDLPHIPRDDKDWLNPGPSYLVTIGLPEGFQQRLTVRTYGALTIRIASRPDLVALKFFAATDPQRGPRRAIDRADMRKLSPTRDEVLRALRWCLRVDGRPDYLRLDAAPLLADLGIDSISIFRQLEDGDKP